MEEGLFPLTLFFCGLFFQLCFLPARLASQNYGMHWTAMFILRTGLFKTGDLSSGGHLEKSE